MKKHNKCNKKRNEKKNQSTNEKSNPSGETKNHFICVTVQQMRKSTSQKIWYYITHIYFIAVMCFSHFNIVYSLVMVEKHEEAFPDVMLLLLSFSFSSDSFIMYDLFRTEQNQL